MFPTEISISFLMAATTEVTSSGNEVPAATIVDEINSSLIPNCLAIETAPATVNLPPRNSANKPPAIINICWNKEYSFFSESFFLLFIPSRINQ